MSTIALTGGGTAGHILPSLALLKELYRYFDRVIFVGSKKPMDKELVEKAGIPFFGVDSAPFSREKLLENIKIPFALKRGIDEVKDIFMSEKPVVLFVKGGFASLPAAYAAKALKIPVVVHESDFSMGLANRLCSSFATTVITSFPETAGGTICIGSPIREGIFKGDKEKARIKYGLKNMPVILFTGGSLGAQAINEAVAASLAPLTDRFEVIHISGNGYSGKPHKNYHEIRYTDDIADLFCIADIVVSRAGANTLAELAVLGKRVVAIPLPKGSSRGDQEENAKSYQKRGFCTILNQKGLSPTTLLTAIDTALKLPAPKALEQQDINSRIVLELVKASK